MDKGNQQGFNASIFRKAVKIAAGIDDSYVPVTIFDAIVQEGSQDSSTMTCYVDSVDNTLNNLQVRYNLCISDGVVCVPADGSTVTIAKTAFTEAYIVKASDLNSIVIGIGNQSWSNDGTVQDFEFYTSEEPVGTFGGFVKIKDPTDPTAGLLKKINNLENLLNDLILNYNIHTHAVPTLGTSAVPIPLETNPIYPISQTTESEIENPHITHGLSLLPS